MDRINPTRPWKYNRWFRFRLRTLLILVTVVAVLLGIAMHRLNVGREHRLVAERIRQLGCSVTWSPPKRMRMPAVYRGGGQLFRLSPPPDALPEWLEDSFLADAFYRIERIEMHHTPRKNVNGAVDELVKLDRVPSISIYTRSLDDRHLEQLLLSVQVDKLYAANATLDRGRMPYLNQRGLTWLCLAHTQFSYPAIQDLPSSLEYFNATRTRISDQGLPGFARLKQLKSLNLRRTPTSSEAIESLRAQMPWCEIEWERLVHF